MRIGICREKVQYWPIKCIKVTKKSRCKGTKVLWFKPLYSLFIVVHRTSCLPPSGAVHDLQRRLLHEVLVQVPGAVPSPPCR